MEHAGGRSRAAHTRSSFSLGFGFVAAAIILALFLASADPGSFVSRSSVYLTGQSFPKIPFFRDTTSNPDETALPQALSPPATSPQPPPSFLIDEDQGQDQTPQPSTTTEPPPSSPPPSEPIASSGFAFGTFSGVGTYSKRYYRFSNVQLTDNDTLTFYLPPGVKPPAYPTRIDFTTNNASNTDPPSLFPTTLVVRVAYDQSFVQLNVSYVSSEEQQPNCTRWEQRPVYLLAMQHSENIWHAWNDGLLGAFRTMREHGLLPLAEIDSEGNMKEYTEDYGEDVDKCLLGVQAEVDDADYDENSEEVTPPPIPGFENNGGCRPRRGVVPDGKCSPGTDAWCREGLVAANVSSAPVLLPFKGTDVIPHYKHLFKALSSEILSWNASFGTCFSELYVGKSNVIQFYMPLKKGKAQTMLSKLNKAVAIRSNATAAAKEFMLTAERLHREERHALKPHLRPWRGYKNPALEKLRQGVGPEDIEAVQALRLTWEKARYGGGDMREDEFEILEDMMDKSARQVAKAAKAARRRYRQAAKDADSDGEEKKEEEEGKLKPSAYRRPFEQPRPVVTYMWREAVKRSVLNAQDILSYILTRYNVTVRVTTFSEPRLEAMELMGHTDVLIGMHGAGWTNAIFIKRGAGALQLMPYGWIFPNGDVVRGQSYKAVALASDCVYSEWANKRRDYAFIRRPDIYSLKNRRGIVLPYTLHPDESWEMPKDNRPGNQWVYQNTFVDIFDLAPEIDRLFEAVGITPMDV